MLRKIPAQINETVAYFTKGEIVGTRNYFFSDLIYIVLIEFDSKYIGSLPKSCEI